MSSRKTEERNEKIIRGLMKLPPNRRCINCNSLGPQYVCTNFWTFVCITCSGIHREFTHRVKSVSMSKFTSQEIESLQNGGNQRARETFLNDWDPQRQRFPDSSNADKVREFIKNIYVDKKYAGRKTSDKPPRGMQDLKSHEDETRRASSYHSYSQSPPYDYEYEERRYGKQAFALTRKTGSDRGLKTSSFLSPSRSNDHVYEDRSVNEGSHSRVSDYSVSSAGDTFRSDTQSPTFQRGIGFSSPSSETSRDILSEVRHHKVDTYSDTNAKREVDQVPHSQRTASTSSFGSFNSNSMSFKSVNSENAVDIPLEAGQSAGSLYNNLSTFLSLPQSSISGNSDSLDLFNSPFVSQTVTSSASAPDLFQLPTTSSKLAVDLFQPSSISSLPILNFHQPSQTFPPSSLDLFSDMPQQQSVATLNEKSSDVVIQKNEGWATFDIPQHMEPSQSVQNSTPATIHSNDGGSLRKLGENFFLNTTPQWSSFHYSSPHGPHSSIPDQWHESLHNVEATLNAGSGQLSWNAFENPIGQLPFESIYQQSSEQVALQNPSSIADQYIGLIESEDLNKDGIQSAYTDSGLPIFSFQSHESISSNALPVRPVMAGALSDSSDIKSTNPFDIPYDSDLESSNGFLDMSSLQAVLPNGQMHTFFIGGVTDPWFTQNPVTPYTPVGPQGGLGLLGGPAPSTQITTVPSQGPVAPIGGNPFA